MRKFILFTFSMLFFAASGFAQFLKIDSPTSVAGVYATEPAGFGGMIAQDEVIVGDLILADPLNACDPLTIDATDKIVLLDRGTCEFGVKCLNAENAGAKVVVVANNQAGVGTIVMGVGAVGDMVTIPCVMISFEDGQILKDALAAGTVTVSYGDLPFDFNIGTGLDNILVPLSGTIPAHHLQNEGDVVFAPGVDITNFATVDAELVFATATIDYAPAGGSATQIYEESGALEEPLMVDSARFIGLAEFDLEGAGIGTYTISYSIEGEEEDEVIFDNAFSSTFNVTTNVYSKSNFDETTGYPTTTGTNTVLDGGAIEFLTGYQAINGEGYRIDSVSYFVSVEFDDVLTSLANINIQVFLYEWIDGSNGGTENGAYDNEEVMVVGVNTITYPAGAPESTWTTLPFINLTTDEMGVNIPEDGRNYIVGVRYEGASAVSFGFNTGYDYEQIDELNLYQTQIDFPYLGSQTNVSGIPDFSADFTFTDYFAAATTAVYINPVIINTEQILSAADAQLSIFPNPASDNMNVSIDLAEMTNNFEYRIMDMQGRLIETIRKSNLQKEVANFDVSDLPNGQYILTVATDKGIVSETFTIQR